MHLAERVGSDTRQESGQPINLSLRWAMDDRAGTRVVGNHVVSRQYIILERDVFAAKVCEDLAAVTDAHHFLDFHERSDLGQCAPIRRPNTFTCSL
jgi:hypothetical protein